MIGHCLLFPPITTSYDYLDCSFTQNKLSTEAKHYITMSSRGRRKENLRVDRVEILERVCRAGDVAQLPVDLPLDAGDVEEHVHPGEVGGRGEGGQAQLVLHVNGRAALHGHVEHLEVTRLMKMMMDISWNFTLP